MNFKSFLQKCITNTQQTKSTPKETMLGRLRQKQFREEANKNLTGLDFIFPNIMDL